jgi:hypothetical protein
VRARDGALRRLTALNRLAAAGTVALVLGFTALAAKATPPKHRAPTATVTRSTTSTAPDSTAGDDAPTTSQSSAPPPAQTSTPAPAPTTQAPLVISGGS